MPFLALALAWLIAGSALANIVLGVIISTSLGFLARLLSPKPPKPGPVTRDVTVNQPDTAWQIVYGLRVVGGSLFCIELSGTNNEFLTVGIVWCYGGPDGIESIDEIWFGDEVAVNGTTPISKYSGLITVQHNLGTDTQAALSLLTGLPGSRFVSTDVGAGHAYTVLRLKFDENKFSDFTIEKIRAKIKGRKVLDPRTGTVAYSANPVLCVRDYLANTRFGLGYGQGARSMPVIMDDAFNNAQANICEELVNKKAGGTRVRYGLNMAFTADSEPGRVVQEMFVAMGGGPSYVNGKWRLLAGAWRPPVITLDDDDLRGPVQMKLALGRLNTFNAVRGEFMDPTHWQPTNYPPYGPAEALVEDGGIRIWKDLDFAGVTDAGQAQQLAKLGLEIVRRPKRIMLPCKFLAYELAAGDTFRFTHDDWVEKTFAVEKVGLPVENDEQGQMIIGVDVFAREEDPGTYYWNPAVDEGTYTVPPSANFPGPGQSLTQRVDPTGPATVPTTTPFNGQGNLPATSFPSALFSVKMRSDTFVTNSRAVIKFTWAAQNILRADGSTLAIPASSSLTVLAAPILGQVAGGTLGARTRFVRIALVKDKAMHGISNESSFAISVNNLLKVTAPAAVTGYDGWAVLFGTTTNNEGYVSNSTQGSALAIVPLVFGADWTEPTTGAQSPADFTVWAHDNTAFAGQGIRFWDLGAVTTYKFYPALEVLNTMIHFPGQQLTAVDAAAAIKQSGDGEIALAAGALSFTTPADATSGTGTGGAPGGGRGLLQ
jgi:hypothetical protein